MPVPAYIPNVVAVGLGQLTSSYAKQPNIRNIIKALLTPRQETENMMYAVYTGRMLGNATLYPLPTTNSVLDAIGALVGQPRNGMSDVAYQGVLFLKVAVNRSTGRAVDWANFARILLQTSGGGVEYLEGEAAFDFGVFDMTLPPIAIAGVLANAVPNGVRGAFIYSTWAQSLNFEWGSVYSGGAGQGGFGSVYDNAVGGLLVGAQPLSILPQGGSSGSPETPLTILEDVCFWCRSDLGMTGSSLVDLSGTGNSWTQPTGGDQATVIASDPDFNGRPSLSFNGSTDFLSNPAFIRGTGPDLFIWYVMKLVSAGSFPMFFSEDSGNHEVRGNAGAGAPMMSAGAIAVTAIWGSSIVGVTKAVSAYDEASGIVGVNVSNGTAVETTTSAHSLTDGGIAVAIGARPGPSSLATMKVAEIVVTTTMPTSAQRAALQQYGVNLYGAI